jgi:hypothetical protein
MGVRMLGFRWARALAVALLAAAAPGCGDAETAPVDDGYGFELEGDLDPYEVSVTVDAVPPGYEDTRCITVNVGNDDAVHVRRFRGTLTDGSHHMIAYRSTATEEDLVPSPCFGFSGLLSDDHPVFIAQQHEASLPFPTDGGVPVALTIAPRQMLRLELHYINTTAAPLDVNGALFIDTIPMDRPVIESDLAFWGTTNLNGGSTPPSEYIPAGGKGDTGVIFQRALPDTKSFAVTTHQHQLGTRMRVWPAVLDHVEEALAADVTVADNGNWADPPLVALDPPIIYPASGGTFSDSGLAYRCEWNNPTPSDVYWGEGFNDEMCFLWHYYYPSQGFQVCMAGLCLDSDEF